MHVYACTNEDGVYVCMYIHSKVCRKFLSSSYTSPVATYVHTCACAWHMFVLYIHVHAATQLHANCVHCTGIYVHVGTVFAQQLSVCDSYGVLALWNVVACCK